jgi:hypothetical protein
LKQARQAPCQESFYAISNAAQAGRDFFPAGHLVCRIFNAIAARRGAFVAASAYCESHKGVKK